MFHEEGNGFNILYRPKVFTQCKQSQCFLCVNKKNPQGSFKLIWYTAEDSYVNFSLSQIDNLVDSAAGSLRITLDSIAPLKRKIIKHKRLAPWFNSQTRKLKQTSRKLERIWRSTKVEESCLVWQDSLKTYRKALCNARAAYYSALIEENKNSPRFLFSTLADKES